MIKVNYLGANTRVIRKKQNFNIKGLFPLATSINFKNLSLFFLLLITFSFTSCDDNEDNNFTNCTSEPITATLTEVAQDHVQVYTSIVIDASPEQVWNVLTDFDNMPNWSSALQSINGELVDGNLVNVLFGFNGQTFEIPHTLIYQEGVQFGWSDPLIVAPGIVDNHIYLIEPCGAQTLFIQTDEFLGTDSNLPNLNEFAQDVLNGYQIFNNELKTAVENN